MYGVQNITDANPSTFNPDEDALRDILTDLRQTYPSLEIGFIIRYFDSFKEITITENFTSNFWENTTSCNGGTYQPDSHLKNVLKSDTSYSTSHNLKAEMLKSLIRIGKQYKAPGGQGQTRTTNYITSYFDWVSVEDEWWNWGKNTRSNPYDSIIVNSSHNATRDIFNHHLTLIDDINTIIDTLNVLCNLSLEVYQDLVQEGRIISWNINSASGTQSITDTVSFHKIFQAEAIGKRVDRVLAEHYFFWPQTLVERFCENIMAWDHALGNFDFQIFPLFSAEASKETKSYCPSSKGGNWGDFLGWWMDPSFNQGYTFPSSSQLGTWYQADFAAHDPNFPYHVSDIEADYLAQLAAASSQSGPVGNCNQFVINHYLPDGNMWFILNLLSNQNIVAKRGGLENNEKHNDLIKAYPNPTSGLLHVRNAKRVTILNFSGEVIKEFVGKSKLDFEKLPTGIYFLSIIDNNDNRVIRKINKQ